MIRPFSRILHVLAFLCVLASAGFFLSFLKSQELIERTASRLDAGRCLTNEERLITYTRFASHDIPAPGLAGLPNVWVRAWYRFNPMHPGPGDVLSWGSDYRGPCGSRSRVVVAMLKSRGVHSRLMLLLDPGGYSIHTVVETEIGGRWVVTDPTFDRVFRNRAGLLATQAELAGDRGLVDLEMSDGKPYPDEYSYTRVAHANWRKIPVVLPAARTVLERVIGRERVLEINEPTMLWSRPRAAFAALFAFAAVACMLAARALARRAGRPMAEARNVLLANSARFTR